MDILALIAEFKAEISKERQTEGIAKAKAEGRIGGRPKLVTDKVRDQAFQLLKVGNSIRKVAEEIGFSKATVQKFLQGKLGSVDKLAFDVDHSGRRR
jgi:DNA invertase Pin-like site-specific DNA recombinase